MQKLKNSFLFSAILFLAFAIFAACSFGQEVDYSVTVSNFPYGTEELSIKLQSFDSAGYLFDDFELGKITGSKMTFPVTLSSEATFFYVYIYDESGIKYYGGCPIEDAAETNYDISGYWYIYYEYGPENNAPYVALDEEDFITLTPNQSVTYTYSEVPVAVYELNDVKNKKISIDCTEGQQVFMYMANNKEDLMTYNMDYVTDSFADALIFTGSYGLIPTEDTIYFLVRPKRYDSENIKSFITFTVVDESKKETEAPLIGKTFTADNKTLFFIEQNKDGENTKSVYSIDLDTKEVQKVIEMEKTVTDIYIQKNELYIASDKTIYTYDLQDSVKKILYKFDETVTEILLDEKELNGFKTATKTYDSEFKLIVAESETIENTKDTKETEELETSLEEETEAIETKELSESKLDKEPEPAQKKENDKCEIIARMFEKETVKAVLENEGTIIVVTNKTDLTGAKACNLIEVHKLDNNYVEQFEKTESEKKTLDQLGIKPLHFIR